MIEEWRKIGDFPYEVSNKGNVRNIINNTILKPDMSRSGYPSVTLYGAGKKFRSHIHRLVATCFIPNPENKRCVDHINTIITDNKVENLRWVTVKENVHNPISFRKRMKPHTEQWNKNIGDSQHKKPVLCEETGDIYSGICEASRKTGVPQPNISKVLKGLRETAGGFHWKAVFFN